MIGIFGRFARSAAAGCLAIAGMFAIAAAPAQAAYVQNFDTVVPAGWAVANNNSPGGSIPNWYQGVDPFAPPPVGSPLSFPAFNGPPTSYAAATYLATGSTGQIDTWLISPELTLNNGDTFSFYARQQSYDGPGNINGYANALQARLSTSGASTSIGGSYGSVGVFTDLKVDINPTFNLTGMPEVWTQYSFSYTGAATTGRVAFRFYTPDVTLYGSYMGVDAFETSSSLVPVPEPASFVLMGIGLAGLAYRRHRNRASV